MNRIVAVAGLLGLTLLTSAQELVTIQRGTLPLILTAPHGGKTMIDGVPIRAGDHIPKKRGAKANFSMAFDKNTDKLAVMLADEIEKQMHARPFVVIAHFSRKQIDANRPIDEGVESPIASKTYQIYHNAIAQFRSEIIAKWGCGLLVDLHGHGGNPKTLIRGTADRTSVRHLIDAFGEDALTGKDGLLGPLAAAGIELIPPNDDLKARENPALNGGYTTRHYGSYEGGNFDAIQFETGSAQRSDQALPVFAKQLADALVPFTKKYLLTASK